ncbi:MAG: DUF3124 domain-containing protein [Phycisphaerales bacterium]|nr:DUF3124 domain-containing protein [Phycisphaerales bacterium]MCB9856789.1 DUF3124 domain-containing protein [Phycisphaerales bacterium]MCB9862084.1 DUF3124 domain-containing protein [Phycisphaerales bacterium]
MNDSDNIGSLLSRASDRFVYIAVAAVIALIVILIAIMIAVKGKVEHVEDQLRYRAPRGTTLAGDESEGEAQLERTVYVPVYSHVYIHEGVPYNLTTTLSVRNTDTNRSLIVKSARYHDSDGKLVQSYLDQPLKIGPLATTEFLVAEKDSRGGSGASFVIGWAGHEQINPPIIEAVMIGASGQQGISLTSRGIVIEP